MSIAPTVIAVLLLETFCATAFILDDYRLARVTSRTEQAAAVKEGGDSIPGHRASAEQERVTRVRAFKTNYLLVYALVTGADWLQGPYLFSLYHEEYEISLHTIALLFVLGFLSAGLSAPIIGRLADAFGRKRLCVAFCISYFFSCLTKLSSSVAILAVGRGLGGVATSILFSIFESWLISQSRTESLKMSNGEMAELLGRATMVNAIVAALSGIISDQLVAFSGTYSSPFQASAALLVLAGIMICYTWEENFGEIGQVQVGAHPWKRALQILRETPALLVLPMIITSFETSMFLFVLLWVPLLQETLEPAAPDLPLGLIFSCFMVSMMLGSLVYNRLLSCPNHPAPTARVQAVSPDLRSLTSTNSTESLFSSYTSSPTASSCLTPLLSTPATSCPPSPAANIHSPLLPKAPIETTSDNQCVKTHARISAALLLFAAVSLAAAALLKEFKWRFLSFVAFEAAVGLYYPTLATLRALMLPDECRATLTALFRAPVNFSVTLALVTGMESRHDLISLASCSVLVLASASSWRFVGRKS